MVVFTAQIQAGWLWSYEIDGGLPQANDAERYVSADDAIQAGMRAAMRAIDGDLPVALQGVDVGRT